MRIIVIQIVSPSIVLQDCQNQKLLQRLKTYLINIAGQHLADSQILLSEKNSNRRTVIPEKDPFLKETLFELINHFNGDINQFLSSILEQYTYIEVHESLILI